MPRPRRPARAGSARLHVRCARLARSYRPALFRPAEVALVGRVNAGKSSLLNALVGRGARHRRRSAGDDARCGGRRGRARRRSGHAGRHGGRARRSAERLERRGLELGARRGRRGRIWWCSWSTAASASGTSSGAPWDAMRGRHRSSRWNKRDLGAPRDLPSDAMVVATAATTGDGVAALGAAIAHAVAGDVEEGVAVVSERQAQALDDGAATRRARGADAGREASRPSWPRSTARRALDATGARHRRDRRRRGARRDLRALLHRKMTADVIVVLGAALGPEGDLGAVLAERVLAGVDAWRRGRGADDDDDRQVRGRADEAARGEARCAGGARARRDGGADHARERHRLCRDHARAGHGERDRGDAIVPSHARDRGVSPRRRRGRGVDLSAHADAGRHRTCARSWRGWLIARAAGSDRARDRRRRRRRGRAERCRGWATRP